jgi:hypothetical protein
MTEWIHALSEPAVTLAAQVWETTPASAHTLLSRYVQAELLSPYLPLAEFQEYIEMVRTLTKERKENSSHVTGHPALDDTYRRHLNTELLVPPQSKPKEKDYSLLWFLVFLVALWLWGQYSNSSSASVDTPQYPLDQSSEASDYNADQMEQDTRNYDPALAHDTDPGSNEPLFDPVDPYETTGSCPNGCTEHITGCDIKGNIAFETAEKIYHVPGQEYYELTTIDPSYGERWFCTEAEAISNGWRKSKS